MARAKVSFSPILPKQKFSAEFYRDEWEVAMRQKVKPDLKEEFKKTVEGWDRPPTFVGTVNKSTHFLRLLVKASRKYSDIYAMIDITGAKPHQIHAKNAPTLRFQSGYQAATRPKQISSRRKQRFGRVITPVSVNHPGFEPRLFSETIAEQYQPRYEQIMNEATRKATKRLGNSIS